MNPFVTSIIHCFTDSLRCLHGVSSCHKASSCSVPIMPDLIYQCFRSCLSKNILLLFPILNTAWNACRCNWFPPFHSSLFIFMYLPCGNQEKKKKTGGGHSNLSFAKRPWPEINEDKGALEVIKKLRLNADSFPDAWRRWNWQNNPVNQFLGQQIPSWAKFWNTCEIWCLG